MSISTGRGRRIQALAVVAAPERRHWGAAKAPSASGGTDFRAICPNWIWKKAGSINGGGGSGGGGGGEGELVLIDKDFVMELEELFRASAYVLGKSRLGIVYKVVLGTGAPVAVRRLGEGGGQRYREFAAEVQAIGRVRHPNIVRLRAYYWASDEKLLISDFISNGNLSNALRGKDLALGFLLT